MRRRVACALGAMLLLTGCAGAGNAGGGNGDDVGFQTGDGTFTLVEVAQREPAPILEGPGLNGEALSTADLEGQIIVVNVWGSWCAPCRAEAPHLVEAADQLGDDVSFLGLNTRDLDVAQAQAFERAFDIPYPSIFDPDGERLLGFGELPPKAIPSTVVIDEEGRVAARVLGQVSASTLVGIVEDVKAAQ